MDGWNLSLRDKEKLYETLSDLRNEGLLYRNLSQLRTDVPLPDTLDDLLYTGADRERVEAIVETVEGEALLERTIRYK